MEKIKDIFSRLSDKIKNNKLIVIIMIAVLVVILLILTCVFVSINKEKEELSAEQLNAYMKALDETNSNFEDIEQIEQGLKAYDISDEYGRVLNEEERNHIIKIMGYEENDVLESSILNEFKVYTPQELVESGIVISNEFLDIYGDETYYINVIKEGNEDKNVLIILKDPRKIGTEDVYSKPEEDPEFLKIVQGEEGEKEEVQIPGIIVSKSHNAKAKIQFSYGKDVVKSIKYATSLEEMKEYTEPFYLKDNQLIVTNYKQNEEDEEKEGNSKLVSCLRLLSPTYKVEEVEKQIIPDEAIVEEGADNNEAGITNKKIPTLVFAKVKGEGYNGEVKYKYRVEVIDEEGYVIEEEEGEADRYELTQEKRYNLHVTEKPKDDESNINESNELIIKINGSEIVEEEKSNNTQLEESFKVEAINSKRRSNRYIIFRVG